MHKFIVKKNENGLFNIKAVDWSDMQFSIFNIEEQNLNKEMDKIRKYIRICYDTDDYKAKVNFEFI